MEKNKMTETILNPRYDSRKSFYKKAKVITLEDGITALKSYNTIVVKIIGTRPLVTDTYSATTLRHIKEFLKQWGYKADSKAQILEDYSLKRLEWI